MKSQALGMIEVRGLTAAIDAADTMLKTANVSLAGTERIGSGLVTVIVRGDVGAVESAVEAGLAAASSLGQVISSYVIPRPHNDVEGLLPKVQGQGQKIDQKKDREGSAPTPPQTFEKV